MAKALNVKEVKAGDMFYEISQGIGIKWVATKNAFQLPSGDVRISAKRENGVEIDFVINTKSHFAPKLFSELGKRTTEIT